MRSAKSVLISVGTYVLAAVFAAPVLWVAIASLSTNSLLARTPIPIGLNFVNYVSAWIDAQIGVFVFNSLLVSISTAVIMTVLATMAAYAVAKTRLRFRRIFLGILSIGLVAPIFTYIVWLLNAIATQGLLNNRLALILVSSIVFIAVPLLLLMAFFRDVPGELLDAARVDGASEWGVFWRIAVPLARPAIVTSLIFGFVWTWNDLFLPAVFLQNPTLYTIPQGIISLRANAYTADYVRTFAAAMISTVPMILLYRELARRAGSAITGGALKG
ncbi:MAG: carbohydrate transporter permease [Rhodoglobus sp.]|nr:carbohydrate transporter permease [Rhodoglobus sp.]